MIALPYINTYIIWFYDASISYFALAKYTKKYGAITPYMLNFSLFYRDYNNFINIYIMDTLYFLWCKYGCFIFIKHYHIFL